jgi:acetolactate synthase-1/2/3 large subunit
MRLTDTIVGAIEDAGVDTVFGLPCEQMDPYYAALDESDVRHILARSEASAAIMADGYARASGGLGVADGVGGPGASQLGIGLVEADGASSPVLAITGDNPRDTRGNEVIQDGDNGAILDPYVKSSYDPATPERAVEDAAAAIREALAGVPAPTHLNLTGDLIAHEFEDGEAPSMPAFDRAFPTGRPAPDADALAAAVDALDDSERPVIVSGEGSLRSKAFDAVDGLARTLEAPVVTSMNGKGIVDETSDYAAGVAGRWGFCQVANDAVEEADTILVLGARMGELSTVDWTLYPEDATIVHVDLDPEWLGKTQAVDIPIQADVRAGASALAERVSATDARAERIERIAREREAWYEGHMDALTSDDVPIKPQRVFHEIENALPPEGVLVSATSFTGFFTGAFYRVREPGVGYIQARGSDGINYCLPQALGVQAARPDVPVVAASGDGAIGYHIAELETAVREDLPITLVVVNNQAFGSSKMSQMATSNVDNSTDLDPGTNYAAVAEGFGCDGQVIEDPDELPDAMAEAVASDHPTVLDVRVELYATPPVLV